MATIHDQIAVVIRTLSAYEQQSKECLSQFQSNLATDDKDGAENNRIEMHQIMDGIMDCYTLCVEYTRTLNKLNNKKHD